MKVLALLPVRNEAWVLRHTLKCLTDFCDVVLVNDQDSQDGSPAICRDFSRVCLIQSANAQICEQARWQLFDAARDFEGHNLLWMTDADELLSPGMMRRFLSRDSAHLRPGVTIDVLWYQLWYSPRRYRDDLTPYRPHWKSVGFVDDRTSDYDRSRSLPLHESRVPMSGDGTTVQAGGVPLLHLQWLLKRRNQLKQAWYRCREWMHGQKSAAEINALYSITFDAPRARTTSVPGEWLHDLTVPEPSVDAEPSWHEREILGWFDQLGVERFEPLEIWHIESLRDEFRRRAGRRPRPDRSYRPRWPARARRFTDRALRAVRRASGF